MRRLYKPMLWFATQMLVCALLSLGALVSVLLLVMRLDIAFFESNGMIKSAELRSTFYTQIFEIDPLFLVMLELGLFALVVVSMVFCKSQFDYYGRLAQAFSDFAKKGQVPTPAQLGRFNPHIGYFFDVSARRMHGEPADKIKNVVDIALGEWPKQPRVSWIDQAQFVFVSGILGLIFSALCAICYWKATDRIIELSNLLVRFPTPSGPQFLTEQFVIVNYIMCGVLALSLIAFMVTGYKFGSQLSEVSYAMLRDLRRYMAGELGQRLVLRKGSVAQPFAIAINETLDKISQKIEKQDRAA